ncbi:MAG TPA: nuclease, partial [Phenylobacterium sp.]|nr:nuclease [Phenylobacterium sp.]
MSVGRRAGLGILCAAVVLGCAGPVQADPCTAPVSGFRAGQVVAGKVRYVGDGDSLCIGRRKAPSTWLEIRLANVDAAELDTPGGKRARRALAQR